MSKTLWLGAMNFGGRVSKEASQSIIAHALSRGLVHIDTSNSYGDGESERIVGASIGKSLDVVVATKVGMARRGGRSEGLSPQAIVASVDASRKRLGRDILDILYLHAPDPETPIEATLETLVQLIDERKIGSWAVSNYAAWQVAEMLLLCEARKWPKPALSQVLYNTLVRQIELEYLPFARARGVKTVVYNPLAGGLLSGKHRSENLPNSASRFAKNTLYQKRYWSKPMFDRVTALEGIARDARRSLVALSYGFLAAREGVSGILVGPSEVSHIDDAIDAMSLPLDTSILNKIDAFESSILGTDARYAR